MDSWIYVIQAGGERGPVKIGLAGDPAKRLALLQTGNHLPLRLVCVRPGTLQDEKKLHRTFASERLRGEWFSPDVLETLRELRWDQPRQWVEVGRTRSFAGAYGIAYRAGGPLPKWENWKRDPRNEDRYWSDDRRWRVTADVTSRGESVRIIERLRAVEAPTLYDPHGDAKDAFDADLYAEDVA